MKKALKTAARGTVFPYAGEKWVVLEHDPAGRTLCLRLDLIPNKPFDENNCNNVATSSCKEWMNGPYLDNLIDAVKVEFGALRGLLPLDPDLEKQERRDEPIVFVGALPLEEAEGGMEHVDAGLALEGPPFLEDGLC